MKRLFALIGLPYLVVLAVVFNFYSDELLVGVSVASAVMIIVSAVLLLLRKINARLLVVSVTSLAACFSVFLYTSYTYMPVVSTYADTSINAEGYISDSIVKQNKYYSFTLKTTEVNSENKELKIDVLSKNKPEVKPFEYIRVTLDVSENEYKNKLSKGIFLSSVLYDDTIVPLDDYAYGIEKTAYDCHTFISDRLGELLSDNAASLGGAVILGDKYALSMEDRTAFTRTGTSFLIVVSGMHLSVLTGAMYFLLKKLKVNSILSGAIIIFETVAFMALIGFTPSIVRAGVMTIIVFGGLSFYRKSDSLNSLGLAALVLTILNPYAVGDVGLLLSFSATAGMILWSPPLYRYIADKLMVQNKILQDILKTLSVAVCATLWTIPVSALFFDRISPLSVVISFMTCYAVSAFMILCVVVLILSLVPLVNLLVYPICFVTNIFAEYILSVVRIFGKLSFSSVNADKLYIKIWIISTIAICILCCLFVRKSRLFKIISVLLSVLILSVGYILNFTLMDYSPELIVFSSGRGVCIALKSGDNATLLSCGGNSSVENKLDKSIENIDFAFVPSDTIKYSSAIDYIEDSFSAENIMYSTDIQNTQLSFDLYEGAKNDIIKTEDAAYQYVTYKNTSVLIISGKADVADITDKYKSADYLIADTVPENIYELDVDKIIIAGTEKNFNKQSERLTDFTGELIHNNTDITISLDSGGYYAKTQ